MKGRIVSTAQIVAQPDKRFRGHSMILGLCVGERIFGRADATIFMSSALIFPCLFAAREKMH